MSKVGTQGEINKGRLKKKSLFLSILTTKEKFFIKNKNMLLKSIKNFITF